MALFVTTTESKQVIEWHIGDNRLRDIVGDSAFVVEVQADYSELYKVQHDIDGIRKAHGNTVVRWFGDDARFIVENL